MFRILLQESKDALQRKKSCASSEVIAKYKALLYVMSEMEGANAEISYQTGGYGNGAAAAEDAERYLGKLEHIKDTLL